MSDARAMWAAGGSRRQVPADAAASQLAGGPAFPLLPGNGAQPSPGPLVKIAQKQRSECRHRYPADKEPQGIFEHTTSFEPG
jgi:hypothetical protein